MLTFKDYLNKDIANTFFNSNEFAEKVVIEGIEMTVLFEEEQSKRTRKKSTYDYGYSNHSETTKTLSLKESDYALLGSPKREESIYVNDTSYLILEIEADDGMVNLKVQVYR